MTGNELINKYFPEISEKQQEQFLALEKLYLDWNSKINVISRKDMDNFYERHVLHSLGIAQVISFKPGTKILDAGTGGGFPGIPLAILFPDCEFHLVDSTGKKIKVVKAVVQELVLKNAMAEQERVENLRGKYDFIITRAVTELPLFYQWVKDKISKNNFNDLPNGILALKGGDLTGELEPFEKRAEIYYLKKFFEEKFFETKKVIWLK